MKAKTTILAALLSVSCMASANVQADENPVRDIVTSMVKNALAGVSNEIEFNIKRSVLANNHKLLEGENTQQVAGKVTITDIEADADVEKEVEKEDSDSAENSDD